MDLAGRVAVVTGGASGIGAALGERFAAEGARAVVLADIDGERAARVAAAVAASCGARGCEVVAVRTDVAVEDDVVALVDATLRRFGVVDLFCANAGIAVPGGIETPNADWQRLWDVNVMAHVYAARAVLPSMLERGEGYLLLTASAAGLLTGVDMAAYAVSKHAVVGLAEALAIQYGDRGIRVSCLCPQGVRTEMMRSADPTSIALLATEAIEPEAVADSVVAALRDERFHVFPHPEVAAFLARKVHDQDRWLAGMRRLRASVVARAEEARDA